MTRDGESCLYYPFIARLVSREFNAISHNAIRYLCERRTDFTPQRLCALYG